MKTKSIPIHSSLICSSILKTCSFINSLLLLIAKLALHSRNKFPASISRALAYTLILHAELCLSTFIKIFLVVGLLTKHIKWLSIKKSRCLLRQISTGRWLIFTTTSNVRFFAAATTAF